MQTLEMHIDLGAIPKSKLNPTIYITVAVVVFSVLVLVSGSMTFALVWPCFVVGFWVLAETDTVTEFLHRFLTHGSIGKMKAWLVRLHLWFSRSGMVKYWEWVITHAAHHELTDTELDSYTPQVDMVHTRTKKLRWPHPFNFWYNGRSYRRAAKYYEQNPGRLDELAREHEPVRKALCMVGKLEWARRDYGNIVRGYFINVALFAVVCVPLAVRLGGWLSLVALFVLPWAMTGVKAVFYLFGGYIINYFGHLAEGEKHQSNIPWWIMLLTFFVLGEGWHRFHHDAPWAARFNRGFDPGYWKIWVQAKLGLVSDVVVAEKIGHRKYRPSIKFASI